MPPYAMPLTATRRGTSARKNVAGGIIACLTGIDETWLASLPVRAQDNTP
ncbi:hypothetical protein PBR20603_03634 [Pandoraea bronchicola]|uniref:Uncharacterized protein n=1 Tax=Pandoraea bronchicola TaxID=2508287 RepID=A0A5E5BX07_9BURK|nr:hypothetical protein PBR20603_03634 [Pandoraea bronchicola]